MNGNIEFRVDRSKETARAPGWIVCRSRTRSVVEGEVYCPVVDVVGWQRCLECRFLESADDDRLRGCGGNAEDARENLPAPPTDNARWPQLIIELL